MGAKDVVLIIDDSTAIGILLTEFLKKLGYADIKTTTTGESGLALFKELINNKIIPLVFLDYNLPDTNAKSVMSQILIIQPDTKIIIETASGKDEDPIKEVIGLGAYHYIQKPIHFEAIKNVMKILEEEESILEHTSSVDNDGYHLIDRYFNTYKRVTLSRLIEQSNLSEKDVTTYLKKLISEGKVVELQNIREICCNACGSLKLAQIYQCPNCKNSNFDQVKLIEHFDCGNFSPESTYGNDKCPKCKKQIKALGVDYRVLHNRYLCKKCDEIFQDISNESLCLKCNTSFKIDNGRWRESMEYKLTHAY
ncbi:response regulator [Nitrosopumilus sp.]|uniref:TackOD1 domain-containing metal-binding protein n=1 Tax=Nitrosopumilus sp. TaxID=2024843 RepID=UPI00247CF688|nr:response regulator [Nitrosopumilus sp.]MCV0409960.1 response regulator [Nitrosopumilus sp.]